MDAESVSSITAIDAETRRRRGMPYSSALMKSSSTCALTPCARFAGSLALKARPLVDGIVQLGKGIAVLAAVDEELEAFRDARLADLALGERRNFHRIVGDKGRLNELVLDEFVEARREAVAARGVLLHVHALLGYLQARLLVRLPGMEVQSAVLLDRVGMVMRGQGAVMSISLP